MSEYIIASVAIENSTNSFDMAYDYLVNENDSNLKPGCRVLVPFGKGNKCRQGIVMSVSHSAETTNKLKSVMQIIDEKPILSDEMIKLIEWLKERTFCTLFDAAKTILPAGMCHRVVTTYAAAGDECFIDQHMGFIKFGSRVDLYLPLDVDIKVALDQKTVGNETIIAEFK